MRHLEPALHEFLVANRNEVLERSRTKLAGREAPTATTSELTEGLPRFLDQLIAILCARNEKPTVGHGDIAASATLHGRELLRRGLTVGQVVQDYGSLCQSVTELAAERDMPIAAEDFQTFNQCLDEAIAQAVTAYEHQRDESSGSAGVTRLGFLAHEMRNLLSTSMLTFDALSRGTVGIKGSTGAVLGRSLRRMRVLIDRTLAEVRLGADIPISERIAVDELIEEIEIVATIEARDRDVHLSIERGAYDAVVDGDRQILAAAVANLVQNAFKFTPPRGHVVIRSRSIGEHVWIEVQDECGGLPPGSPVGLFEPFKQASDDRSGLGLGLTISLKGVRAYGGEMRVLDLPGRGCVFTIDLPRAPMAPGDVDVALDGSSASPTPSAVGTSEPPTSNAPWPSLLIADDDEEILSALEKLLSGRYRVTTVRKGDQALEALRHTAFDLAIVDLGLPVVDGLSLIQTIPGRDEPPLPPFLVVSEQTNPQMKARAIALGAMDYLTKPFHADELLATITHILATVSRNAGLAADAMMDSLTGLAKHRSFSEHLDRELERSRRYGLPLSLILLDLDHMKVINDQHGHAAGDDAIKLVGRVLAESVRKFEMVARQGGDEFAVILPHTRAHAARQLADRLREAVGAQAVLGTKLSASIGLVSWENSGVDQGRVEATTLVKASDDALYRAKRAGRDRVEAYNM